MERDTRPTSASWALVAFWGAALLVILTATPDSWITRLLTTNPPDTDEARSMLASASGLTACFFLWALANHFLVWATANVAREMRGTSFMLFLLLAMNGAGGLLYIGVVILGSMRLA